MGLDTFCMFEQVEELEYRGWIGNPAEETLILDETEEDCDDV